jgi:hypothetical protein
MEPPDFRIVALPSDVASQARDAARSGAAGYALVTVDSRNAYPCRQCLRWAEPGERVILFTYSSIPAGHPYSESGPIFVHELPCAPYDETDKYPSDFRNGRVIRAYDSSQDMIDAVVVDGEEPEAVIAKLFANPQTAFLQVRSVTRGCFTFRIERSPALTPSPGVGADSRV